MAGAPYTTMWLDDCLHGRRLTTLEDAVRHLTDVPARLFGLRERGRIAEGYHADLVLFDPDTVGAGPITLLRDLPGGNGRLVADAHGVSHVIVGGVDIVVDGSLTGELPGRIIRSGADTYTVSLT
jgi:N-acyl-D-aspartate/D-glutamate deacylase